MAPKGSLTQKVYITKFMTESLPVTAVLEM